MKKLVFLFFVFFLSACVSFQVGGGIQKGRQALMSETPT